MKSNPPMSFEEWKSYWIRSHTRTGDEYYDCMGHELFCDFQAVLRHRGMYETDIMEKSIAAYKEFREWCDALLGQNPSLEAQWRAVEKLIDSTPPHSTI